jgi:hypothetical protein
LPSSKSAGRTSHASTSVPSFDVAVKRSGSRMRAAKPFVVSVTRVSPT